MPIFSPRYVPMLIDLPSVDDTPGYTTRQRTIDTHFVANIDKSILCHPAIKGGVIHIVWNPLDYGFATEELIAADPAAAFEFQAADNLRGCTLLSDTPTLLGCIPLAAARACRR